MNRAKQYWLSLCLLLLVLLSGILLPLPALASKTACVSSFAECVYNGPSRAIRYDNLTSVAFGYSQAFASEKEPEEKLFKELGCYFRPSIQGLSAKAWLENVANQLLRGNRS